MTRKRPLPEAPEPADPLIEAWETGLTSTARVVATRLAGVLNALCEVNDNVARGTLPRELWEFRIGLHERLVAAGWRISAKAGGGWRVLPPLSKR